MKQRHTEQMWWLDKAQSIPIGHATKIRHVDDGMDKTESVTVHNTEDAWSWWCFRRNEGGRVHKQHVYLTSKEPEESGSDNTPDDIVEYLDTTRHVQVAIAKWLNTKGLTPEMFNAKVLGYSESRNRLIISTQDPQGKPVLIGRSLAQDPKRKVITYGYKGLRHSVVQQGYGQVFVLTEDILSATKVHYAIRNNRVTTVSLNGTKLNAQLQLHLTTLRDPFVMIMLDGDTAGHEGSLKIVKELRALGIKTKVILIPDGLDPKDMSIKDIQCHIQDGLFSNETS